MATLGTLTHELKAALEAIDQQSPVDFLMAETLADAGLVIFNQDNDYWYELTATGEMQLGKYAAWDELRAECDAALVEVARLKEALAWYANEDNYDEKWDSTCIHCPNSSNVQKDEGERARKALSPEQPIIHPN